MKNLLNRCCTEPYFLNFTKGLLPDSNMAVDCINDKLSIKNLLFTKAMPNYVASVPTNGHKLYPCTDCGDKFIIESSYEDHINRKSLRITYMCRYCGKLKIFYNRCNLLCHIRSHSFKTATINVTDLKIEPLPLAHLKMSLISSLSSSNKTTAESSQNASVYTCTECKTDITSVGAAYKDRKNHYMQYTNEVYTCLICLFALPTACGLKAHIRIHLKRPPYYCPECGIHLPNKSVNYPYNHDCEGFKMMRATARLRCPIRKCQLFHPNSFIEHMKLNHLKKVFKCPFCVVACFNESTMVKHLQIHVTDLRAMVFYQCELCPGRLVLQNHMDHHLKGHVNIHVFPCWVCGTICKSVSSLITHHYNKHNSYSGSMHKMVVSIIKDYIQTSNQPIRPPMGKQTLYRVVKRCDKCKRNFIYKCRHSEIHVLPNICPYNCSAIMKSNIETIDSDNVNSQIICHMCKIEISQDWEEIKIHYAEHHKNYRCLDPKIKLDRIDVGKYLTPKNKHGVKHLKNVSKKMTNSQQSNKIIDIIDEPEPTPSTSNVPIANDELTCNKCGWHCENKQSLESHMICHRDPYMAYQCLECGQSFVVKPSFSTHLLLEHNIADVEDYINEKQCYNENALSKQQPNNDIDEPLCDNQCSICREQFEDIDALEKHFRVHGMAFLIKNTSNKNIDEC